MIPGALRHFLHQFNDLQGPLQVFLKFESWRHEVAPCSRIVAGFQLLTSHGVEKNHAPSRSTLENLPFRTGGHKLVIFRAGGPAVSNDCMSRQSFLVLQHCLSTAGLPREEGIALIRILGAKVDRRRLAVASAARLMDEIAPQSAPSEAMFSIFQFNRSMYSWHQSTKSSS